MKLITRFRLNNQFQEKKTAKDTNFFLLPVPFSIFIFSLLTSVFFGTSAHANPFPTTGPQATTVYGTNPIYSPGIKPSIIIDDLGVIDSSLTQQKRDEFTKKINEWKNANIEYAAKYNLTKIISPLRFSLTEGAKVNPDKTLVSGDELGTLFYYMSPTRLAFQSYLIDSGKIAIDLDATHIIIDASDIIFPTLSFDNEIVAAFAASINEPAYDIRSLVIAAGYTKSNQIVLDDASLTSDTHWPQWINYSKQFSHNFFSFWSTSLKNYASSQGKSITLLSNGISSALSNGTISTIDLSNNEVTNYLLDSAVENIKLNNINSPEKNYPAADINFTYKIAIARNKRFWSKKFPNNTDALDDTAGINSSTNQPANNTDRIFIAQTFANGGLSQIADANQENFINFNIKPTATVNDYQFTQQHPELFNHAEASEMAIVYGEYSIQLDPELFFPSFKGASYLLSDAHRLWDVIFAADINSVAFTNNAQASDPFTLEKLSEYKTIILPHIQNLSDVQVSVIETYLNANATHTVIGFGTNATHTETNILAAASRTFDDLFGIDATDTTTYTGTVISFANDLGKNTADNANTPAARSANVSSFNAIVATNEITTTLPSTIQITRFLDNADSSHIYHLVNRNVDTSTNTFTTIASGETLTIPLPIGYIGTPNVSLLTPDSTIVSTLSTTTSGNNLIIDLPALGLWNIIKVGSNALLPLINDNTPWSQIHLYNSVATTIDDAFDMQGLRPDTLNPDNSFKFGNRYWKGGLNSNNPLPFEMAYLATDDFGIAQVEVFYRYSAEYSVWSSWFSAGIVQTGINGVDIFTINNTPYGDGHYQFYTRATDSSGQLEQSIRGAETGYGIDTAPPSAPDSFVEINGMQHGVWQNTITAPIFSWQTPVDNLSGAKNGWLTIKTLTDNSILAACDNINLTTTNSIALNTCITPLISLNASSNQLLLVTFKTQDIATNLSEEMDVFEIRIGTKTVQNPENSLAIPINSGIVVRWDTPTNITNFDEVRVYISRVTQIKNKWDMSSSQIISGAINENKIAMSGLVNGVEYRIAIESFDNTNNLPGDLISVTESITPQAFSYGLSITETIESAIENTPPTLVSEDGITDRYSLVLSAPPTENVEINVTNNDQIFMTPTTIIFTPKNWNITQDILITAVNDNFIEDTLLRNITHTVTSLDANYNRINVSDVSVTVIDNDNMDSSNGNSITPDTNDDSQNTDTSKQNSIQPISGKKSFFGCSLNQSQDLSNKPLDPTLPILILLSFCYLLPKKYLPHTSDD